MIRETFDKSAYKAIEKIDDTTYHLMWDKVDVVKKEYLFDEEGNITKDENGDPVVISAVDTDFCKCTHATVKLPKNINNIFKMIEDGKKLGYKGPSLAEWAAWVEIFGNISFLKERAKANVLEYDGSSSINQFTISDVNVWLDKATRAGLKLRFESEKANGLTETTLWYNGMKFVLDIDVALNMLFAIEMYASACYDKTQEHLANIDALEVVDTIVGYDHTVGYPDKLVFSL